MIGADKEQVCKWVMNVFGLVRHSFIYILKTFSLWLLDERKTALLLKTFSLLIFIRLTIKELLGFQI